MHDLPLEPWAAFYVIVGSSAGALTGLQFVVMTLIAENPPSRGRVDTISAFGTPNVVHFCAALLISAVLSAPWHILHPVRIAVAASGALGVIYTMIVWRRAIRQGEYKPVFEDWLCHVALPLLAYAALLLAGLVLGRNLEEALLVIGGAALLLVFVGIHNAWDTVTYVTAGRAAREEEPEAAGAAGPSARPAAPASPGGSILKDDSDTR